MKRIALFFLFVAMGFSVSMTAQVKSAKGQTIKKGPSMSLETTVVDYGTIEQGSDPFRYFEFSNEGSEPLVIKHAKGSCGCTVPEYEKEPIMPGETSQIKVRYDTKRVGKFTKTVTLTTNEGDDAAGKKRILTIKGTVLKKAAEPDAVPKSKPSIFSPN